LLALYIKKVYDDDPVFRNARIIWSVYDNDFSRSLDKSFKDKLMQDGIDGKDLKVIDNPDFLSYCKLVVNMSDGIIIGSEKIHPGVANYIEKSGKPTLPYHDQNDYVEAYSGFYETIINGAS
jgi:starch synthase